MWGARRDWALIHKKYGKHQVRSTQGIFDRSLLLSELDVRFDVFLMLRQLNNRANLYYNIAQPPPHVLQYLQYSN